MNPSLTNETCYIVATIKPWNIEAFKRFTPDLSGTWLLAESPKALQDYLDDGLTPEYIFFPHWNWLVPQHIYENYECVCFHMTDVPYGRGGSPLQNLIVRGHKETKLTALKMVEELDAGPIYLKKSLSLDGSAQTIFQRVAILCYELIQEIIVKQLQPKPQKGSATLFKRRTPEQSEILGKVSINELYDFIRMLDAENYPKAFIKYGDYVLEFSNAKKLDQDLTATVTFKYWKNTE